MHNPKEHICEGYKYVDFPGEIPCKTIAKYYEGGKYYCGNHVLSKLKQKQKIVKVKNSKLNMSL